MRPISLHILKSNIKIRLEKVITKFCSVDGYKLPEKFIEYIRNMLVENIEISQPLVELVSQPFTELPKWLFNNESSTKYRSVRTVNGYPMDVAKSAMQKYSRRGMPAYCMYAMADMNFFKWLEGGKSSFTNFKNRIKVILLEDSLIGEI